MRYPEDGEETKLPRLPDLRKGMTGKAVQGMQILLELRGFSFPKWGTDGDWGEETQNAVEAFQKKAGLTEDGIRGPATWKALTEVDDADGL